MDNRIWAFLGVLGTFVALFLGIVWGETMHLIPSLPLRYPGIQHSTLQLVATFICLAILGGFFIWASTDFIIRWGDVAQGASWNIGVRGWLQAIVIYLVAGVPLNLLYVTLEYMWLYGGILFLVLFLVFMYKFGGLRMFVGFRRDKKPTPPELFGFR